VRAVLAVAETHSCLLVGLLDGVAGDDCVATVGWWGPLHGRVEAPAVYDLHTAGSPGQLCRGQRKRHMVGELAVDSVIAVTSHVRSAVAALVCRPRSVANALRDRLMCCTLAISCSKMPLSKLNLIETNQI